MGDAMGQRFSYQWIFSIFAVIVGCLVVGCGAASAAAPTSQPHDAVTVQMGWTHEYSAAFLYAAEKNHHFAENNLDVTLVEGGFVDGAYVEPIDAVLSGEAEFGEVSATAMLQARAEN